MEDLDHIQIEISKCKDQVARALYRAGKLLAAVRWNKLWRLRRHRNHPAAERVYDSFREWLAKEGYFSYGSADRLIKLSERISANEFRQLTTELVASIRTWDLKKRVPEIKDIDFSKISQEKSSGKPVLRYNNHDGFHMEVYEESPDGKISVELEQEDGTIEIVRMEEEHFRTPTMRRFMRPPRPENKMVRVDLNLGMSRVKLWKRPSGGNGKVSAGELEDDPWFELPLSAAVKLEVRIIRGTDGALEAICQTKRITS
jgi:hypothetical protein